MQFFLKINGKIIEKANFITEGCGASVAIASQTTLLIESKSLDYAKTLKPEDINEALKGLPEDKNGKEWIEFRKKNLSECNKCLKCFKNCPNNAILPEID